MKNPISTICRLLPWIWLAVAVAVLPPAETGQAAGFDCGKASTAVEKLICGDDRVSELDSTLGRRYGDLRSALDPAGAEELKRTQLLWLESRDRCDDTDCLEELYRDRIGALSEELTRAQYAGQAMEVTSALEQTYDDAASLVVRFSVPIDRSADFRRFFSVKLDNDPQPAGNWLLSEDGLLAIYPFVEPDRTYVVRVTPGLRAVNGTTHAANRSFTIKTRRSQPSAGFAGDGQVMSPSLKRALPVVTLNVDEVSVDFFRIAPEEVARWSAYSGNQRQHAYGLRPFTEANSLVHTGRFPIDHRRHQRTTTNLDLSEIPALDRPGAYLAVLRVPGRYESTYDINFFTVSDIGIQVRRNAKVMHVFSHSIATGQPLEGIEVSLYKGKELQAAQTTGAEGIASFSDWFSGSDSLIARRGDQTTVLRLDRPLDLSGIANAVERHRDLQVFAWGPRNLYRPGERLQAYAILRDFDGRPTRQSPLDVTLIDAKGTKITQRVLNPEDHGAYLFDHPLPESAATGSWKLVYRLASGDQPVHEYPFSVEDFLPERMELTLFDGDAARRRLLGDVDRFELPVTGKYLYGAPAAGNRVSGTCVAELDPHPFERWRTYHFGIAGEPIPQPRRKLDDLTLDKDGRGRWTVDLKSWKTVRSPLAVTTTASLHESGGRPVTRSISVTRIAAEKLVGIEPQFKDHPRNDSRARFHLLLTDRDGQPLAATGYQATLIREDRNYYWTYTDNGGWTWHYDPMEYPAYSSRVSFDGSSPAAVSVPVQWGNYRLEVRDGGGTLAASHRFRTQWYWRGNANAGASLKPDQVQMTFRDEVYRAGSTAHLLLTPPADGLATITVEHNDAVLWVAQRQVSSEGSELEIPVAADWARHDIYVTVTVLTPGNMTHRVAPKRSFGFINLPLRRADGQLEVSIAVPEKVEPNRAVTARVEVTGAGKLPAETFVTVAAVDVGVLNITGFTTPDPAGHLFGRRRYDATYYDIYDQIIENAGFDYSRQRFGGGFRKSAAELSRGGDRPDSEVRIVSLQHAPVRVGADGSAEVTLEIPDFDGRLRWMAVVYAPRSYGSAEAETTVASKVVTQLAKPRFLALGDKSRLGLDVTNLSGASQELELALEVAGALQEQRWTERVLLQDREKTTLFFPVTAVDLGRGRIRLDLSGGAEGEIVVRREESLGVRSAYPAVTRKDRAVIDPGEEWVPDLNFDDLVADSVSAQLVLSRTPPIDVNSHFQHLLRYPYGCTEQSTSSGYPWVLVDVSTAEAMGLLPIVEGHFDRAYTEEFRKQQIDKAVQLVLKNQNAGGEFGFWSGHAGKAHWLTVYATDFLTDARLAGAPVPHTELENSINRLRQYVRDGSRLPPRWSQDPDFYSFSTRAYAAYVLAKINRVPLSDLRRFYDSAEDKYEQSPLPWAHLGYAFDLRGDRTRAEACFDNARTLDYKQRYYGTYSSEVRDLALTHAVLASRGRAEGDTLTTLFERIRSRPWLSTQERNALFKAAVAGSAMQGDQLRALIQTRDFRQEIDEERQFKTLLTHPQVAGLQRIESKDATVFASLELVGQYAEAPPPFGNEVEIERDYFDLQGTPVTLTELNSGDLVIARLRVAPGRRIPDALVVDLLPAGLELENQNLARTGVDLGKLEIDGESLSTWRNRNEVEHVEYRGDRFVAALSLSSTYRRYDLYYLARAVTPGQYRVPPPYVEDMYRPYFQAIGPTPGRLTVVP